MTRRSGWIAVIGILAIAISMLIAHTLQRGSASAGNLPGLTTPAQPIAQQAAVIAAHGAFMAAFTEAPPLQNARFGAGTRSVVYRESWSASEGFVTADGALYVAVTPENESSDVDDWRIGELEGGNLRLIALPPAKTGYRQLGSDGTYHQVNYRSIVFSSLSTGASPVIEATDYDGRSHLFHIDPNGVVELPYRDVPDYTGEFTLSSGERCVQPSASASDAVVIAVDANGKQRALMTREALGIATRGLLTSSTYITFTCHHFAGQDLLNAENGDWGLVFRVAGDKATLVTRGRIIASGDRRLLIRQSEDGPQGASGANDYLEASRTL